MEALENNKEEEKRYKLFVGTQFNWWEVEKVAWKNWLVFSFIKLVTDWKIFSLSKSFMFSGNFLFVWNLNDLEEPKVIGKHCDFIPLSDYINFLMREFCVKYC